MSNLVDFQEKRDRKVESKRRQFERVMFDHMMGCYTVLEQKDAILPISLVDISHNGCLFQVHETDKKKRAYKIGQEISLRFYFTKNSYLPISVKIRYGNDYTDTKGTHFVHYGAEFDKSTKSFAALKVFINFIYEFAEHSCLDKGDNRVHFI